MARDLTRERPQPRNGAETARVVDELLGKEPAAEPVADVPTPDREAQAPTVSERVEYVEARRDRLLARIAVMLIDAAKLLDPITRIVAARLMGLGAVVAATCLTVYTVSRTSSWERVAVCSVFLILCAWLVRKGQQ